MIGQMIEPRGQLEQEAATTPLLGGGSKEGMELSEPRGPLLEAEITAGLEMEPGRDAIMAGDWSCHPRQRG